MSITLALQQHVPARALRGMSRWLYAGDDPSFELPDIERVVTADVRWPQRASFVSHTWMRSGSSRV